MFNNIYQTAGLKRGFNVDSDHCLLQTTLFTPILQDPQNTKGKTTRSYKIQLSCKSIWRLYEISYVTIQHDNEPYIVNTGTTSVMENIVKALQSATEETLQPKLKQKKVHEQWKYDTTLNELLDKRAKKQRVTSEYRDITKKVKKHVFIPEKFQQT